MIELDCSAGEGGGGTLRVAMPLAVLIGQPLRLFNIRMHRPPETRGVGWTHSCFIDAICRWTGSSAEYQMGSTEVIFTPGTWPVAGKLVINLDDPARTFQTDAVEVVRDYDGVADHFAGNIDNRGGRGIRGHSMAMFLVGLAPLMIHSKPGTTIELAGSTETPGGPFIDAVANTLYPAASRLTGRRLWIRVDGRGCMGRGGGSAVAGHDGDGSVDLPTVSGGFMDAKVSVDAIIYLFGDSGLQTRLMPSIQTYVEVIRARVGCELKVSVVATPYPVERVQQLFLIRSGPLCRDVSICAEEAHSGVLDPARALARLMPEVRLARLPSRFLVEQLIPILALSPEPHDLLTERSTGHIEAAAYLAARLTGRSISLRSAGERCLISFA